MSGPDETYQQNFAVGDRVLYIPLHANGDLSHKDVEEGVVTNIGKPGGDTVFVRYGTQPNAKATYVWNLVLGSKT